MHSSGQTNQTQFLDEVQVIQQSKKDPKSFESLYNRYYESIFRFIYRRMDSLENTADTTAQVFLKALSNIHKYTSRGIPFSAWLYRIALNEISNYYSHPSHDRVISLETSKLKDLVDEIETDETEEKLNSLFNCLKTLPPLDLFLIEMRFFENRPFKEIGDILNITENNAKVKLYRILEKMKNEIQKQIS